VIVRANDVVVVTAPTLPALRSARGLLQEIKTLRGGVDQGIHLTLNQKGATQGFDVSDADIVNALKVAPEMVLNWNPKIFAAAESSGKPLSDMVNAKEVLVQVRKFLIEKLRLSGETPTEKADGKQPSLIGGFLGKMKSK